MKKNIDIKDNLEDSNAISVKDQNIVAVQHESNTNIQTFVNGKPNFGRDFTYGDEHLKKKAQLHFNFDSFNDSSSSSLPYISSPSEKNHFDKMKNDNEQNYTGNADMNIDVDCMKNDSKEKEKKEDDENNNFKVSLSLEDQFNLIATQIGGKNDLFLKTVNDFVTLKKSVGPANHESEPFSSDRSTSSTSSSSFPYRSQFPLLPDTVLDEMELKLNNCLTWSNEVETHVKEILKALDPTVLSASSKQKYRQSKLNVSSLTQKINVDHNEELHTSLLAPLSEINKAVSNTLGFSKSGGNTSQNSNLKVGLGSPGEKGGDGMIDNDYDFDDDLENSGRRVVKYKKKVINVDIQSGHHAVFAHTKKTYYPEVNDLCVAKVAQPETWILSKVTHFNDITELVNVVDAEATHKKYLLDLKYIVKLPEKKDCQPRYFQKNTLCFAMYPDSTEFFPAFIVDNMIKKDGQNCCAVIFDDDIDEETGLQQTKIIQLKHITSIPVQVYGKGEYTL